MKKIKLFIASLLMIIIISFSGAKNTYASELLNETYELIPINSGEGQFKNHVDGYSINIPLNSAISFDDEQLKTQFNFGNTEVKIFVQDFVKEFSYEDYLYYSLKGLRNNKIDHNFTKDTAEKTVIGQAHIVEFNRRKLSGINNDKNNYYILIKKLSDGRALTFMVKSSDPIDKNQINKMLSTFKTNVKRTTPYIRKSKDVFFDVYGNQKLDPKWDEKTKKLYVEDFIKSNKQTWGIFSQDYWFTNKVAELEEKTGMDFKYMILYHTFSSNNDTLRYAIQAARSYNKYVEFTLQTDISNGKNLIYEVLEGKHDDYIKQMAQIIKEEKHPTLIRLANEMNGDWCSYSAWNTGLDSDIYKAYYDYIYNIMEKEGANPYLIYVFNPNGRSFPDFKYNQETMYRPLDDRFHIMGLTLYNTGTYYPGEKWESFEDLYDPLYKDVVSKCDKPLMITEFSSSSIGGDKVAWTKNMLNQIEKYNRIKVAIWFNGIDRDANGNPARVYLIDDPIGNAEAFKEHFLKTLFK